MTDPVADPFDRVIHSGPRITILIRLVTKGNMRLGELAKTTGLTPGNLSAHLSVLESAGYVERERLTTKVEAPAMVRITNAGEQAFRAYVKTIRAVLAQFEPPGF